MDMDVSELRKAAAELCACVGHELKRRRDRFDFSADDLAVPGVLGKQTVFDHEKGEHAPRLDLLEIHCRRLGTEFPRLLASAVQRKRGAPLLKRPAPETSGRRGPKAR